MRNTTTKQHAPYDYNKATLPAEDTSNARNYGGDKETIQTRTVTVFDAQERSRRLAQCKAEGWGPSGGEGFTNAIDARWYTGRSRNASVVYCTVWISTRDGKRSFSGTGSAGGYGYCKSSAAFEAAVRSAGIKLEGNVGGAGDSAVRHACTAIAKACGFGRLPQTMD